MERARSSLVMARSGLNAVPKSSSRRCPATARLVTEEMYACAQWLLGTSLYDFASAGSGEGEQRRRRERCEGEDVEEDSA